MVAKTAQRIEKHITLRAPRSRVWRALSQAEEFGSWFGASLAGDFRPSSIVSGRITLPGFDHLALELQIERVEPESYISYRWHPYAVDPDVDYSSEPTTLVELRLEDAPGGGTKLTVIESGFENIPLERRAKALEMNDGGWSQQLENIALHVAA
jgi:uncharacterized protein YndB with AHSA1/START domain